MAERAAALLDKLAELPAEASPHLPARQAAVLLLRNCCAGKLTHLLRTTPPASCAKAAAAFDEALLEAYQRLTRLDPLTAPQRAQCRLPLRLGGRGLRSQEQLAPVAWVGSWAQSLAAVRARTGLTALDDLEQVQQPLAAACRAARLLLPQPQPGDGPGEGAGALPAWADLAEQPRTKVQKELTRRLDQKNLLALRSSSTSEDKARLNSCGGPHAGSWQQAAPGAPGQRFSDDEFCSTARELLGQDLAPPGACCANRTRTGPRAGRLCGEPLCNKGRHAFRCSCGGGVVARSRDVEDVWERIHTECGFHTARQVPVPAWDRWAWRCARCDTRGTTDRQPGPCGTCGQPPDARREEAILDLEVQGAGCPRLFIDVTVRYAVPGDAAALAAAARHEGAVNAAAEADKRRRYPEGRCPWPLLPLALETGGRHGRAALRHLRQLAREQAELLDEERAAALASSLAQRWGAELSVALQRAKARQLRTALGVDRTARAAELRAAAAG